MDNDGKGKWSPSTQEIWQAADLVSGFSDMGMSVAPPPIAGFPKTEPVHHPIGHHNPHGSSGAAQHREKNRKVGVAAGRTNPYRKDLQGAEKQLRKAQRNGEDENVLGYAKQKVKHYHERVGTWNYQQTPEYDQHHELPPAVMQQIAEAAEAYAEAMMNVRPRLCREDYDEL